jgi:D-alanyl-D-alanine carboxypeptidase
MNNSQNTSNKTRRNVSLAIGGLVVAGIVGAGLAPNTASASVARASARGHTASLQADLDAMVLAGAPGAILLVRDGHHTTHLTSGVGEVATNTPIRPDDHFKIASLTKTYTATVVLQLVAEHKMRLDDSVEQWLPGLVPNGQNITVRQLLSHTSGLFDYEADPRFLEPYFNGDLGFYWAPRDLVGLAVSHDPLFPPGQTPIAVYSNTNYVVAGLIVEAVTGRSIGDEFQTRLFNPLHLDETVYPTEPELPSPYAHGYMVLGGPPALDVTGLSPSMTSSAGGIVSTTDDVADFYRALLSGRLLPKNLLRQMETTRSEGTKVDIPGQQYGLGLETFPTSCGVAWGHNGVVPGYLTFIFSSKDGQRQAVLMVNHDAGSLPGPVGTMFFDLIAKAFCSTSHS